MVRQRPWFKGMASAAALAVAVMVVGMSPVSAAFTPTKAKIKKIAKNIAKKQVNAILPTINGKMENTVAYVASAPVTVGTGLFDSATATCPAGHIAVGGGASTDYSGDNAQVEASYPSSSTTVPSEPPGTTVNALGTAGWTVSVENEGADDLVFKAIAICVKGVASPAISGNPYILTGAGSGGGSVR